MTIIDTYPNVERAITSIEASLISKREYEELKNISNYIRNNINKKTPQNIKNYKFIKNYLAQTITTRNFSNTAKEIIIGNILLPDDIKIAELLTKNGFTIEHLNIIIRFRALLKNIILNSTPINEELERQFKIYKTAINKIIEIFKLELNFDDQTTILNRITEILITNPNYFESKNSEHIRKR